MNTLDKNEDSSLSSSLADSIPDLVLKKSFDTCQIPQFRRLSVREIKIQRSEHANKCCETTRRSRVLALWKSAFLMVSLRGDPWEKFGLYNLPEESAKRYRYNALKGEWIEDMVRVKVENTPFNRGAMRECFRAKKLSNFAHADDWSHALNFVAKRYIEKVVPQVYFDDVRLQMDAKLWGEEFSRQPAVSKKVDVSQMCVIEFIDRPDKPLYHLEHFIEGTYRKYNSNSGFVDEIARNTPQAFSHFTFERSGHRLIVVDIQGVGDLWTDPQIHTFDGKSYGDGNLGIRGMALFFHTHRCNPLCEALNLSPFDLPNDVKLSSQLVQSNQQDESDNLNTVTEQVTNKLQSPCLFGGTVAVPAHRRRQMRIRRLVSENLDSSNKLYNVNWYDNGNSSGDNINKGGFIDPNDFTEAHSLPSPNLPFLPCNSPIVLNHDHSPCLNQTVQTNRMDSLVDEISSKDGSFTDDSMFSPFPNSELTNDSGISFGALRRRKRNLTNESCPEDFTWDQSSNKLNGSTGQRCREAELLEFFRAHQAGHRSSSVVALRGADAVILGAVHHEMARLHASGRLAEMHQTGYYRDAPNEDKSILNELQCNNKNNNMIKCDHSINNESLDTWSVLHKPKNLNWEAVIFHEEQASVLNCLDAIQCLAQYYLGLPIDGPLAECPIKPDASESLARGLTLMSTAASAGDRSAMVYLAEVNYTGIGNCPCYDPATCAFTKSETPRPDWSAAAHWYEMAAKHMDFASNDNDDDADCHLNARNRAGYDSLAEWPIYRLHGRLAEMYAKGGYGIKYDPIKAYELFESAADGANEASQGRLAAYYYEKAAQLEEYQE